ncbi:hypothetical protein LB503_002158 [Fusarium chuoi]|nr:hypothetical protein LB503_002158 [Fusarium chuoi]
MIAHLVVPEILNNSKVIPANAANETRLQVIATATAVFGRRHSNEWCDTSSASYAQCLASLFYDIGGESATDLNNLSDQRSMRPWKSQQPGNAAITRHERDDLNALILCILQVKWCERKTSLLVR